MKSIDISKEIIWAPAIASIYVVHISIVSLFSSSSLTITSIRSDSSSKAIPSETNLLILFSFKNVLFSFRRDHFWTRSVLIEGPQYSIYQKRDQEIMQTPGPDHLLTYSIRKIENSFQILKARNKLKYLKYLKSYNKI